ncbi:MAG: leucine-rich repeat domain-containing protein [Chloroflexi bacterium]|nr:leucine-rich repeat domain-containing protein [Chloroflexota bacterium]
MQTLHFWNNQVSDLTPLAGLTNLQDLFFGDNQITDLAPLAGLTNLTWLDLRFNQIGDLLPLAGLTSLQTLVLFDNQVTDLAPMAGLTGLQSLFFGGNQVSDLTPLAGLTNLQTLDSGNNQVSDLSPLAGLTGLQTLFFGGNQVSDLTPLAGLTNLTKLDLRFNQVSDLSPLANNPGLDNGDGVDLRGNPLSAEALETHIPALQTRGVNVLFDEPEPVPPTVSLEASPVVGEAPLTVRFTAEASDTDGTVVKADFDFDGDGVMDPIDPGEVEVIVLELRELNDSGQSGLATLTALGNNTEVVLSLSPGVMESTMVHIHSGQCGAALGGVLYPLADFADGTSATILEGVSFGDLPEYLAINVHSSDDPSVYTAGGDTSTVSSVTFTHTYASPGTFDATVTVVDNDGLTASATVTITVLPSSLDCAVHDLQVTNVSDVAFAVTWRTVDDCTGLVEYGTEPGSPAARSGDDRGAVGQIHHVTLIGLSPDTTYYFGISSGSEWDDNSGQWYKQQTGPTLSGPGSHLVFGQVFQENGLTPASNAIVYLTVQDNDGQGISGTSQIFSSVVDGEGFWNTNIGTIRTQDLGQFFDFASQDLVCLEARGGSLGQDSECVPVDLAAPAPDLVLSTIVCTDIRLVVGLNFIGLPYTTLERYTASTLAAEIARQGGQVDQLDRWDKSLGRWQSHKVGYGFNDFAIVLGEAYFLKVTRAVAWQMCGYALEEAVPLELVVGLNGVAVPYSPAAYTASTLAEAVAAQGGQVDQLDLWDQSLGRWQSHKVGYSFNNFAIESWRGYFLKVTGKTTFTPGGSVKPPPPGDATYGGVLTLALGSDPAASGWHPYSRPSSSARTSVESLLYNRLLRYSYGPDHSTHDFALSPDLAESWEITGDGLTYTFRLRQDVTFHAGYDLGPILEQVWLD